MKFVNFRDLIIQQRSMEKIFKRNLICFPEDFSGTIINLSPLTVKLNFILKNENYYESLLHQIRCDDENF